uniref:Tubulin-specific chaperone A n=1 Tax=Oryctolagus cuniculus TaxID=9986 RepID=A0A5F9CFE5_RABIT
MKKKTTRKMIEKMRTENAENYAIEKLAEILQESWVMTPGCQHRLEVANTNLQCMLESEKDLQEAEEYKKVCLVLDLVK